MFNKTLSHFRARVEHLNWEVQCHAMFRQVYRGSYDVLSQSLEVMMHTINIKKKKYIKYESWGDWPHSNV